MFFSLFIDLKYSKTVECCHTFILRDFMNLPHLVISIFDVAFHFSLSCRYVDLHLVFQLLAKITANVFRAEDVWDFLPKCST